MAIEIYTREEQADGQFNGGAILEKNPLVFLRTEVPCVLIQTFFIGPMHGAMREAPLANTPTRDLRS